MPLQFQPDDDIIIPQNAGWSMLYVYAQGATKVVNDDGSYYFAPVKPIDISSYTPKGEVRARKNPSSTLYAEMSFDMSDADTGVVIAHISEASAAAIPESGRYDIILTGPGSDPDIIRLTQGRAVLDRAVTTA